MAMPLVTTEMASAADKVPLGDLSLVLPSSVTPLRSSRRIVTTRRISSRAGLSPGSSSVAAELLGPPVDDFHFVVERVGHGQDDRIEPAQEALDSSLTPLSRLLAVAITLNPLLACTSVLSSGMGRVFSERIVIKRILHFAGNARHLLDAADQAGFHGLEHRALDQAPRDGPSASRRA